MPEIIEAIATSLAANSSKSITYQGSASSVRTRVQVVDNDGNFCSDFQSHIQSLGLDCSGSKFNVIAVLGPLSSGKSTLLNSLFGTTFPELDSQRGFTKCTDGILAAMDIWDNTLVMDVEGTDSAERGENGQIFERRASSFSLAVADALIVNMGIKDIGRYAGSNLGLLKTVIAVNLEFFCQPELAARTALIFVIRDYSAAVTCLDVLKGQLMSSLTRTWRDIEKPAAWDRSELTDFFDIAVFGMPHKIYEASAYKQGVESLRHTWELLKPGNYSRGIRAEDFAVYAENAWQAIINNSVLNIPSQRDMVATYRCDEIRSKALAHAKLEICINERESADLFNDSKRAEKLIVEVITNYHTNAWRYHSKVYEEKKSQLLEELYQELQKLVEKFLRNEKQRLCKARPLEAVCRRDGQERYVMHDGTPVIQFWAGLRRHIDQWGEALLHDFKQICDSTTINCVVETNDESGKPLKETIHHVFNTRAVVESLEETIAEQLSQVAKKEGTRFERFLRIRVIDRLDGFLHDVEDFFIQRDLSEFWTKITDAVSDVMTKLTKELGAAIQNLHNADLHPISNRDFLALLVIRAVRGLMLRWQKELPGLMQRRFRIFFDADVPCYDAVMTPCQIHDLYEVAKATAEDLAKVLSGFNIQIDRLLENAGSADGETRSELEAPLYTEAQLTEVKLVAGEWMFNYYQKAQFNVATCSCDEIRMKTLAGAVSKIHEFDLTPVKLFDHNKVAKQLVTEAITNYHTKASKYQGGVYKEKKTQLLDGLYQELQKPLEKFLVDEKQRLCKAKSLEAICRRDAQDPYVMHDGTSVLQFWASLRKHIDQRGEALLHDFKQICDSATINCVVETNDESDKPLKEAIHHAVESLKESIAEQSSQIVKKEGPAFAQFQAVRVEALLPEILFDIQTLCTQRNLRQFWSKATDIMLNAVRKLHEELGAAAQNLQDADLHPISNQDSLAQLVIRGLRDLMSKRQEWLLELIDRRFRILFYYDEGDVPYDWTKKQLNDVRAVAEPNAQGLAEMLSNFNIQTDRLLRDARFADGQIPSELTAPLYTKAQLEEIRKVARERMVMESRKVEEAERMRSKKAAEAEERSKTEALRAHYQQQLRLEECDIKRINGLIESEEEKKRVACQKQTEAKARYANTGPKAKGSLGALGLVVLAVPIAGVSLLTGPAAGAGIGTGVGALNDSDNQTAMQRILSACQAEISQCDETIRRYEAERKPYDARCSALKAKLAG